ncbi:hypothetical protein FisN_14Hh277 [Fistulifera solaris]|uniref:Uncharacterized protein n=1 Tax=Fistulifera solaris TaxID=1519565 RepID=A0A1Z5KBG5_FISSO|nr:hypothetical protein FisN_14Hh277 [Fistulifera solaris]|eukprot:GAX23546.1 hypothetical protein FisN_14Hh277 [Fistulifera solaris]
MSSITHLLKSPKRIAQALDWHKASGSVLNVTIRKQQMDLTVASHPSLGESPEAIPSIRLEHKLVNNRKRLRSQVLDELSSVVQEFRVCGLVVNWPIQKDGWCGASCGRVLHTLGELQSSAVIAQKPICLWGGHNKRFTEDQWGRSAVYCRENPNKSIHVASKEQYDCDDAVLKQQSWVEFCSVNWPGLTKEDSFCEDDHNELQA